MNEQKVLLSVTVQEAEVLLNLLNMHPPVPLMAAHALFSSIAAQVAEQTQPDKKAEAKE